MWSCGERQTLQPEMAQSRRGHEAGEEAVPAPEPRAVHVFVFGLARTALSQKAAPSGDPVSARTMPQADAHRLLRVGLGREHGNGDTQGFSDVGRRRHDPGCAHDGGDGHEDVLHVFDGVTPTSAAGPTCAR